MAMTQNRFTNTQSLRQFIWGLIIYNLVVRLDSVLSWLLASIKPRTKPHINRRVG